jgi:hypothetical protein
MADVFVRSYPAPEYNKKEILRYAGVKGDAPELDGILNECVGEVNDRLIYKVCYAEFPIIRQGDVLDLGFSIVSSKALRKNLEGCDNIVLFAATVGIDIDRLVAKYSITSPSKALMFQAIGAERIESLCDIFCEDIARGRALRPRFSAGYGDLPIDLQMDIFRVLDCSRKIGLTLNKSLLMSPTKSVTAVIGLSDQNTECHKHGCETCNKEDCTYRRI